MSLTVFYSWQTDSPKATNRNFIQDALAKAIRQLSKDLQLAPALRDEPLRLDRDTQGISGTPPIVDVIFEKISNCAIFVPDLTFVARAERERMTPNPNVLIEYGWALNAIGHQRIVGIMNTAFGKPTSTNMPFDMRHLRHPLTYHLQEGASAAERRQVKSDLVKTLIGALGAVIEAGHLEAILPKPEPFPKVPSTHSPAIFFQKGEILATLRAPAGEGEIGYRMHHGDPKMFVRLIPTQPTERLTPTEAYRLAQGGLLPPCPRGMGVDWDRNQYGAIAVTTRDSAIESLTELHKNREIWGVNSAPARWRHANFRFFANGYERTILETLDAYRAFARDPLQLLLPLKFAVGFTSVKGFRMAAPQGLSFGGYEQFAGKAVEDNILFDGVIEDHSHSSYDLLLPFFNQVWDACGLERPKVPDLLN